MIIGFLDTILIKYILILFCILYFYLMPLSFKKLFSINYLLNPINTRDTKFKFIFLFKEFCIFYYVLLVIFFVKYD